MDASVVRRREIQKLKQAKLADMAADRKRIAGEKRAKMMKEKTDREEKRAQRDADAETRR